MNNKPRIVLILSYPKSGSTVFGELIGQSQKFVHVGEMERLWFTTEDEISLYPLKDCSCGERLRNCEFWKPYLNKVAERIKELNQVKGLNLTNKDFLDYRNKYLIKKKFARKEVDIYTDIIHSLYTNVSDGEKKIILDSSKELWYAEFLESTKLFDISYIHLVRDLKGVIYSRQKKMKFFSKNGKVSLNYKYVLYDVIRWNIANYKFRQFLSDKNSIFVNYDEMVENPKEILESIGKLMNLKVGTEKFLNSDKEFFIDENHLVHGNQFRKKRGLIKMKKDPRPYNELKVYDEILIDSFTQAKYRNLRI